MIFIQCIFAYYLFINIIHISTNSVDIALMSVANPQKIHLTFIKLDVDG